jgi:hypothetical protein
MKVLYHEQGWAGKYIGLGYWRAFNALGHQCELFGGWNTIAGFDEAWEKVGKPDIIWTSQSQMPLFPVSLLEKIKQNNIILVSRCDWLSENTPPQAYGQPHIFEGDIDLVVKYVDLIEHFSCQEFQDKYYDGWRSLGVNILSLPLAADIEIYKPITEWPEPDHDISFCGGYLPAKAEDLDNYLLALRGNHSLLISGHYGPWLGRDEEGNFITGKVSLDEVRDILQEKESEFYQSARICPCISERHSKLVKYEVLERIFKILASRAFCISDPALAIADYFNEDELCVATSPKDFYDKVDYFIENPGATRPFIQKGYDRVLKDHTYQHRVKQLLSTLETI